MKKMVFSALIALVGLSAQAGVNVLVRGDYVNTPKFDNRSGTETTSSSIFRGQTAKMGFDGKVGEATVTGRLDLGFPVSPIVSGDSLVEYLYISKEIATNLTVHAGKLDGLNGGFESDAAQNADVYLNTLANGGIGGLSDNQIAWSGTNTNLTSAYSGNGVAYAAGNSRGVGLTYKMGDHAFDLQVTNSTNHGTTSTYKRNNIGVYYTGTFADKMISPRFGYMSGSSDQGLLTGANYPYPPVNPPSATPATPKYVTLGDGKGYEDTFMNVGAQMKFGATGVLVEYISNSQKDSSTGGKTDTITSAYVLADYTIDSWKPFAKYEMSEFKDNDDATLATSFKRTGLTAGVELTPKAGDAFRYHLAYASTSDKYGTVGSKETVSWAQLLVGVKYTADILK